MNDEKSLNIKVNPTSNTAITTLIMLANAHYEKALAILEQMGVEKEEIFQRYMEMIDKLEESNNEH